MTELQILNATKNSRGHIGYTKLLDLNRTEDQPSPSSDKALIKRMVSEGLLRGSVGAFAMINITEKGLLRLSELQQLQQADQEAHEQSAKEKAEQKKQPRFENKLAVLNTIIPVTTFLLGLLFGNLDRIATVCTYLWKLLLSLF